MEIEDEYNAKQKESCYQYYIHQLHQFVMDFNKTVTSVNVIIQYLPVTQNTLMTGGLLIITALIHFKDYEVGGFSNAGITIFLDTVIYALSSIYKNLYFKRS